MTTENLLNLAQKGKLGQSIDFEGYCVSAAIDACFDTHNVPVEVYKANHAAVMKDEINNEGKATDRFYELLASLAFRDPSPKEFKTPQYCFNNLDELRADLREIRRDRSTILLDVNDGFHSVGLKPVGDNPDEWQIVGAHQIIAAATEGEPIDVHGISKPKTVSTEQVWEYLRAENSPNAEQQTASIFPPEPC